MYAHQGPDYPLITLLIAVGIAIKIVNVLKGKWWTALLGGGLFEVVGAVRLAKPGSWWDTHRSSSGQRQRSAERFAGDGRFPPR
jgi:hypothetical protein